MIECFCFGIHRVMELLKGWNEGCVDFGHRSDMHGSRESADQSATTDPSL